MIESTPELSILDLEICAFAPATTRSEKTRIKNFFIIHFLNCCVINCCDLSCDVSNLTETVSINVSDKQCFALLSKQCHSILHELIVDESHFHAYAFEVVDSSI